MNKTNTFGCFKCLVTLILCAVISVSVLTACDDSDTDKGENYKEPSQSEGGNGDSDNVNNSADNSGSSGSGENADDGGLKLPTVDFPVIPFD